MPTKRNIYLIMLLVPLFWGGAFGTTKHVVTELPPMTTSAIRFLLAALVLASWVTFKKGWQWQLIKQNWLGLTALGITGIFTYNYLFASGLQYTSAISAALVIVVNPVFTACIAIALMGETLSARITLGIIVSLTGLLLVITHGDLSILANQAIGTGELYLLGAVASWVAYTLLCKIVAPKLGAMLTTTVSTIIGSLMLLAASLTYENGWSKVEAISGQTVFELFYLAIFATVIAFVLFSWAIQNIGATKASAYINLMPINALWISVLFYGETISLNHLIGMILTITGVVLTTQSRTDKIPDNIVVSNVNYK